MDEQPGAHNPPPAQQYPFRHFPAVPVLLVALWSLATLGIYMWWWLYSRTAILNSLLPDHLRIPPGQIQLCISGFAVTFVLALVSASQPDNASLKQVVDILSFALNILVLVWVFAFRRGIHFLLAGQQPPGRELGFVMTMLFPVLYLQYHLNRLHTADDSGLM